MTYYNLINDLRFSKVIIVDIICQEDFYVKEGIFHIIFNEGELVDKKNGVLDIEIKSKNEKE